jgi:hypothetical protein
LKNYKKSVAFAELINLLYNMKNSVLTVLICFITICSSAQGWYGEFNIGFPTGDLSDDLSVEFNAKTGYLWRVSPQFDLGPALGFSYVSTKSNTNSGFGFLDDLQIYTIGAAARYGISQKVDIGADLGYGHLRGLIDGSSGSGGFYFRPLIGFRLGGGFMINGGYQSVLFNKNGENYNLDSFSSLQIGISIRK